ncbi:MAG: ribonuclease H-like domain-containing protein [Patescibacteria group bacterium]|nr:ribonuclease H-like domain-containing protein [Patescibacteria group bacterium]
MKILLLDIETAPNLVHVWGLWKQNVGINQIIDAGYVMCWAAKWHGGSEIMFGSLNVCSPKKMLRAIYKLIDEADAVVHFNGKSFDMPTLNKEFLLQGWTPPSTYEQIDLLETVRKQFRFTSNKLDFVAQALGLGKKVKHSGHELWIGCMAGEAKAWKEMEAYNKQDVVLLEKVYNKLLPWVLSHPNRVLYNPDVKGCPKCGHDKYIAKGYRYTQAGVYQRYRCNNCGGWFRGVKTQGPKAKDRFAHA